MVIKSQPHFKIFLPERAANLTLCRFLQESSHPFDAVKSSKPCSTDSIKAFSCRIKHNSHKSQQFHSEKSLKPSKEREKKESEEKRTERKRENR